jgi:PhzF family phenazine biosynthesis protein
LQSNAVYSRSFKQVDVFTDQPYLGNPLAVVLDGTGLSDADMQRFARWTNLSETTFLLPPTPDAAAQGAHYQVRIFSPAYEMPFAGHPTLGSCHAWLEHAGAPSGSDEIIQQCKVGLVRVRRNGKRLAFAAPRLQRHDPTREVATRVAAALRLPKTHILAMQYLTNGPKHFGVLVDTTQTVLELQPDFAALQSLMPELAVTGIGVVALESDAPAPALIVRSNREARAFGSQAADTTTAATTSDAELRFFFTSENQVTEDRVTGSFNASVAQWLIADGHAPRDYVATQGTCIGCDGRVYITTDDTGQVWVGGDTVTCISGMVHL